MRSLLALLAALPGVANAALITHYFEGTFTQTSLLFQAGDTFSGTYTFESTAPTILHPDPTLVSQSAAVNSGLFVGTSWQVNVNSSVVADFTVNGSLGNIAVGNDTAFGDRYIATLQSPTSLPLGLGLNFFQLDVQAPGVSPSMLTSGATDVLPNLSLASSAGGRFLISSPSSGCSQCQLRLTSLSNTPISVPEPPALLLLSAGVLALVRMRRLRRAR